MITSRETAYYWGGFLPAQFWSFYTVYGLFVSHTQRSNRQYSQPRGGEGLQGLHNPTVPRHYRGRYSLCRVIYFVTRYITPSSEFQHRLAY